MEKLHVKSLLNMYVCNIFIYLHIYVTYVTESMNLKIIAEAILRGKDMLLSSAYTWYLKPVNKVGVVVYTCNPSTLGSRGRQIT